MRSELKGQWYMVAMKPLYCNDCILAARVLCSRARGNSDLYQTTPVKSPLRSRYIYNCVVPVQIVVFVFFCFFAYLQV